MMKNEREIQKLCLRFGATFSKAKRSGHYRIVLCGKSVFTSSTSSDVNYLKNAEKRLIQIKDGKETTR